MAGASGLEPTPSLWLAIIAVHALYKYYTIFFLKNQIRFLF
jgi:hypothetical protein